MKIIYTYLAIIASSCIFPFSKEINSLNSQENTYNRGEIPQMPSEEELKDQFNTILEDYRNMSEDDKQKMVDEMRSLKIPGLENFTIENLNQAMEDIEKNMENIIDGFKAPLQQKPENLKQEENTFAPTPIPSNKKIQTNEKKSNNSSEICIKKINESITTLNTLNIKMQDDDIHQNIKKTFPEISENITRAIHYLSVIKSYITTNPQENLSSIEIKSLELSLNKIISLKDRIYNIITFEEFNQTNQKNNLYQKYGVTSYDSLKKYLSSELEETKKEIKKLEEKLEKQETPPEKNKEYKRAISTLEYKINQLEKDSIDLELQKDESKNKKIQEHKEYKKILIEVSSKIGSSLQEIFIKENLIQSLENIIKKYLPKEFQEGKEKLRIQKEQKKAAEKIRSQKGAKGEMFTETSLKHDSLKDKNRYYNKEYDDNFHYESNNYDNSFQNQENEKNEFNFPKQEASDLGTGSRDEKNSYKDDKEKNITKDIHDSDKPSKKKRKKKKKRMEDEYRYNNKDKDNNEQTRSIDKKEEKKSNCITGIKQKTQKAKESIEKFTEENKANKFNQANIIKLYTELDAIAKEITPLIKKITENDLNTPINKENIMLEYLEKTEDKKHLEKNEPEYIKEEIQKIQLLNINPRENSYTEIHDSLYQLKNVINELNVNFPKDKEMQTSIQKRQYAYVSNTIEEYDNILKKYTEKIKTILPQSINYNQYYWLFSLSEIKNKVLEDEKKQSKTKPEEKK